VGCRGRRSRTGRCRCKGNRHDLSVQTLRGLRDLKRGISALPYVSCATGERRYTVLPRGCGSERCFIVDLAWFSRVGLTRGDYDHWWDSLDPGSKGMLVKQLRKFVTCLVSSEKLKVSLSHQMFSNVIDDLYDRYDVCAACNTAAGCDKHCRFTCASCGKLSQWYDGADDERPMDCADCWHKWTSQGVRQ
jgi:hypothetical protein